MRYIQGVHNYDILRNPYYRRLFQYIPIQVPPGKMREDFIIDDDEDDSNNCAQSDLVRLALYFPYMSAENQEKFNFSVK